MWEVDYSEEYENWYSNIDKDGRKDDFRVEYRKQSVNRIAKEASENTTDFIMKKLYGEEE